MLNIYKTDMRRVLKDKLFLVVCIIGAVFSAINPLLYKLLEVIANPETDPMMGELFGSYFYAKSMFFESFLPGNNFGLIMPVLIAIILCKDFSYGTVRNKIICGCSRVKIFLSLFFTSATVICLTMLLHALLTLFIGLIFFEYQATPISISDVGYFIASTGMEIIIYIAISAIVAYLCVAMKNMGLVIVMYIAVNFLFTIADGILAMGAQMIAITDPDNAALKIMEFFRKINIFSSTAIIGTGSSYTFENIIYIVLPAVLLSALFVAFGIMVFRKKDIK